MDYWQRQTKDQPLFNDVLWSRPETKQGAGKLLIIGGNLHGFASVGQAYKSSLEAGIGSIHCLLPSSLKKTVSGMLDGANFTPSTPSGSFGAKSLDEFLTSSSWSDLVLLSGNMGRNSETSVLLEKFTQKYNKPLTLAGDAIDYFYNQPSDILDRDNTLIATSPTQLQKLGIASRFDLPFLQDMGLMLLVQALHKFTLKHNAAVITKELNNIIVAKNGKVSSTKVNINENSWQIEVATKASVLWIQSPKQTFEAMTTSVII